VNRRLATAGVIAFAVFVGPEQASAQLVVFDPNNYAQNVLTAARALQQIKQPDRVSAESGADADQSGEESGDVTVLVVVTVGAVDPTNAATDIPSNCSPRPSASPMISSRSIVHSRRTTRRHRQAFRTRH